MGRLFQFRAIRSSQCLHAQSSAEADQLRVRFPEIPIALIPNAITPLPQATPVPVPGLADIPSGTPLVTFLGRLHPIKNLPLLLTAFARVAPRHPAARLVLAGPEEGHHAEDVHRLAHRLEIDSRVIRTGLLGEAEKWSLLRRSRVAVLPSQFENFGLAAAEALSVGTPVIATRSTPWSQLTEHRAGWWVESTEEALATALEEALALDAAEFAEWAQRASRLAEQFAPSGIAEAWDALYGWLGGRRPRPEHLIRGE